MTSAREKLDRINSRLLGLFQAERATMTAFKALSSAATREEDLDVPLVDRPISVQLKG